MSQTSRNVFVMWENNMWHIFYNFTQADKYSDMFSKYAR